MFSKDGVECGLYFIWKTIESYGLHLHGNGMLLQPRTSLHEFCVPKTIYSAGTVFIQNFTKFSLTERK
jgi:hypothetical protein